MHCRGARPIDSILGKHQGKLRNIYAGENRWKQSVAWRAGLPSHVICEVREVGCKCMLGNVFSDK